jgi:hypothetical protein
MISPIDMPSSYDIFESGLPKSTSTTSMMRSNASSALGGLTNPVQSASNVCLFFFESSFE